MKMLVIETGLGTLEIGFQHFTGDPDVELRRILTGHHKEYVDTLNDNLGLEERKNLVRTKVQEDLLVLKRVSHQPRFHFLVDVGDRRTEATIRPAKGNENFLPDVSFTGTAFVNPLDQYNKDEGRLLSLKRAMDAMDISNADRRDILSAYYAR